jgi:flavin reductase (DIM6/NTAB) family NADH-FMN oxidoreductase RutF
MPVTHAEFRRTMAHFATGVTVVTTVLEGRFYGLTVNAFCSVSLEPTLVLISIDKTAQTYPILARSQAFGVNILTARQQYLSERFARKDTGEGKNFADIKLHTGGTGVPLFDEAMAYLECRVLTQYEGGDHTLLLGEVIDLQHDDTAGADGPESQPLLYFRSRYCSTNQELCLSKSE